MTLLRWTWNPIRNGLRRQQARWEQRPGPVLLLATGVASMLIGVLVASPRTIRSTYSYAVGDFATATVRAPFDLTIRDEEGTARLRDEASRDVAPVAAFDPVPATAIPAHLAEAFAFARQRIQQAESERLAQDADVSRRAGTARSRLQDSRTRKAEAVQSALQEILPEVERQLAILLTDDERRVLADRRFDQTTQDALVALVREAYVRPLARDVRRLREEAAHSRGPEGPSRVVLRAGSASPDRVLPDAAILDDVPGAAARMRGRAARLAPDVPPDQRGVLVGLAARLLVPDTVYDEAATARRRRQASTDVLPIVLQFRRNQLIVDEGHEVTREALLALGQLQQQALPQALLARAAGTAVIAWAMLAALLWLPLRLGLGGVPLRDAAFMLFALLGCAAACWGWLSLADGVTFAAPAVSKTALTLLFPVTAVPMLAGLVLSRRVFVGLCAAIAVCAGSLANLGIVYAAHAFVISLVAGQLVVPCRQRSCVIRAGAATGVVACVTGLGAALVSNPGTTIGEIVASAGAAFAGAAAGGLIALSLSRPIEWVFGYSTKIGLVELMSYDHPLLRRFMERAPGTFQHSVATALLAQAAAEAIGADALLVRVGALYHDVGKLDAPEYYTENQRVPAAYDASEPLGGARVILTHPERGVDLLKEYHVGGRIAEFVREHHGTTALASFLHKAEAAGQTPDPADYRYAGPRPRSRETAVLMMADRIEAMVRSRGAHTEHEFRDIVSRTVSDLLDDAQLDDAPLTFSDLARLQPACVAALMSLYHTRVPYPEPGPSPGDQRAAQGERRDVIRLPRARGSHPHPTHGAARDLRRRG